MTGLRHPVSLPALLVGSMLVAGILGCDAVATGPGGSVPLQTAGASAWPPPLTDVTAYRGDATRTGLMPGPGPDGEPVELWHVDATAGFVTQPLVTGGLILAVTLQGEVLAVDAVTGAQRWSERLPAGVTSSPAIGNDMLFVVAHDGELHALSVSDHEERWHKPGYDPDAAPAVAGELVLAGGAKGELIARRAADGMEEWSAPSHAAARVAVAGDRAAASGDGSEQVTVVNLRDGTAMFEQATGGADSLTPAILHDIVYIAHRDVAGGANGVDAFDTGGKRLWHFDEPDRLRIEGIVVDEDTVYTVTDVPVRVRAVDRDTGRPRWSADVDDGSVGGGVIADRLLYVIGSDHGLSALDTSTGEVAWRVPLEGATRPSWMVVTGGLVIVATTIGGEGRLIALAGASDPRLGQAASQTPTGGAPAASAIPTPRSSPWLRAVTVHEVESGGFLLGGALGPDGTFYVPDVPNDRILVLDGAGRQRWWGSTGSAENEFDFSEVTQNDASAGVAVAPDGDLIAVGEGGNHRVQLFDGDGNHLRFIGRLGRGDGQFVNPCCVTVDADHRIWVVDPGRADVQVFDEAGGFLKKFASEGSGDGQLSRPGSAFVREDADEVLIADFGNRRVAAFDKNGNWLRNYGSRPEEGLYLDEVNAVFGGPDSRMLVVDTAIRIYILDATGSPLGTLALSDAGLGIVDSSGIAVSSTGRVYLVDGDRIIEAQLEPQLWPVEAAQP